MIDRIFGILKAFSLDVVLLQIFAFLFITDIKV